MSDTGTNSFTKWSDLPKELLDLILSKMSFITILNFRAVCPSWRTAVKAYTKSSYYRQVLQVPWLLLPREQQDDKNIGFFSLQDKKVFKRMNTPQEFHNGLCLGTSHGWLVMLDEKVDPYLFNPFSLAQIPLPKLETYPEILSVSKSGESGYDLLHYDGSLECIRHIESVQDLRGYFISKAVVSSDPSHNNGNFFVLIIFELGDYLQSQLAFYRSGDSQWTRLGEINENYCDVVCHNDKFFALNYNKVETWDVLDSSPVKKNEIIADFPEKVYETRDSLINCCSTRSYLVEASGDLLLVERFIGEFVNEVGVPTQWEDKYKTLLFQVYKLDSSMKKWEEVESLGDQVLFLGANQSKCVSIRDIPVCESNSIYFTDDSWDRINEHNIRYDLGVFNMEDKSIKSYYQCHLLTEPPPFWIDPEPLSDP